MSSTNSLREVRNGGKKLFVNPGSVGQPGMGTRGPASRYGMRKGPGSNSIERNTMSKRLRTNARGPIYRRI
jgi:hypothetical protein